MFWRFRTNCVLQTRNVPLSGSNPEPTLAFSLNPPPIREWESNAEPYTAHREVNVSKKRAPPFTDRENFSMKQSGLTDLNSLAGTDQSED